MNRIRVGVRLESLGLPLRRALAGAERLGVRGVQVDAAGDLSPGQLSQTGRRELRTLLKAHNLELTALNCPLRHGLDVEENMEGRLAHVRAVMDLGYDLGPRVVIVQAGRVPGPEEAGPRVERLTESLTVLGQHGDRGGTVLALETGLDPGAVLAAYLAKFDTGGLGVNFDPANLFMRDFDPYEGAQALAGRVVHAHAKDARAATASRSAQEVPLGHGDLDWMRLLGALEEGEYRGWLVVERESGERRADEMASAVAFLRRLVG